MVWFQNHHSNFLRKELNCQKHWREGTLILWATSFPSTALWRYLWLLQWIIFLIYVFISPFSISVKEHHTLYSDKIHCITTTFTVLLYTQLLKTLYYFLIKTGHNKHCIWSRGQNRSYNEMYWNHREIYRDWIWCLYRNWFH